MSIPIAAGPPAGRWIVSARYDTLFFTASLLVPFALWGAFSLGWMTGLAVYVTFQLAFNMPHNFQTWTMSLLEPEDRARHGRIYLGVAILALVVLGVPMALSPEGFYPWVRDALVYWGYFHLVRQHYGFQRIYERRMGGVSPHESWWYGRYLDIVCYAPLLIRFRDPELMTIRAAGRSMWIQHPVPFGWVVTVLVVVYAGAILAGAMHHILMVRRGRRECGPRGWLILSVTVCFGAAALAIPNLLVSIAVVTAYHNIQYLGLVWFHNRTRAESGEGTGNVTIGWISRRRVLVYAGVSFAYGVVIFVPYALFPSARMAELPVSFVIAMHYFIDGRVWRFADYPRRAEWLKLRAPRSEG